MEDYGEHASMVSVCQISIETPIPLQLFKCLHYIFIVENFFFFWTKCFMLQLLILGILALFGELKIWEGKEL